jgi:hypothetical protein
MRRRVDFRPMHAVTIIACNLACPPRRDVL